MVSISLIFLRIEGDKMINEADVGSLDHLDRKMLEILAVEGRISVAELARRIAISKTPCQNRLKRLQEDGYIVRFRAQLDPSKMNREHVAFVEVKLDDTRENALLAFNSAVQGIPEIEQCHMIAGAFDYLLKVRTRTIEDYRRFLGERLSSLPHVSNTSTHVSMQAVKDSLF